MRKDHSGPLFRAELKLIKFSELPFPVPAENIERHFVDFRIPAEVWKSLDLGTEVFDPKTNFREAYRAYRQGLSLFVRAVLSKPQSEEWQQVWDKLYSYLSPSNYRPGTKADLIFVHGAKSLVRAKAGVNLFKDGVAPIIMFSGKGPIYDLSGEPEARVFGRYALTQGVDQKALIIEPNSVSLVDNVKRSLRLLNELNIPFKTILVVLGEFHQLRAGGFWRKYTVGKNILTYGSEPIEVASRENWFKSDEGIRRIYEEVAKLVISYRDNII